jgi:hypothetical protein
VLVAVAASCSPPPRVAARPLKCPAIHCPAWLSQVDWDELAPVEIAAGSLKVRDRLRGPASFPGSTCRLTVSWTGSERGESPPTPPKEARPAAGGADGAFSWELDVPIAAAAPVLRVERAYQCEGEEKVLAPPLSVAAREAFDRYCGLCADHRRRTPDVAVAPGKTEIFLDARLSVAARVEGKTVIDACTGKLLLDLATLGVEVRGVRGPERGGLTEAEKQTLFRAAGGTSVCETQRMPEPLEWGVGAARPSDDIEVTLGAPLGSDARQELITRLLGVPGFAEAWTAPRPRSSRGGAIDPVE